VAKRQMRDFGGVVSFEVDGTADDAAAVCARTRLFTLAVSLGSVESLIQNPGQMTHCTTTGSPVKVPESLVRLSVGLEDGAELVSDLADALRPY
jgi:cystathionine gamma-synthase